MICKQLVSILQGLSLLGLYVGIAIAVFDINYVIAKGAYTRKVAGGLLVSTFGVVL